MHFEQKVSGETKYAGKIISLTVDTVSLENGGTSLREVVHHPGGAAVIALNDNDEIYLVKQYRYPFQCELLEIPAGKLDVGENPFTAAKREFSEETGLAAATYFDLGYIIPTCGYCDEKIYLYAAKDLTLANQHLDDDEFLSVLTMPFAQAVQKVISGEIVDSKTVAAILKVNALRDAGTF